MTSEQRKIDKNKAKIAALLNENVDLKYKLQLKKFHEIYEEARNIGTNKEPKMAILKIGKWYEWFKDEDRPNEKGVRIERNMVIEVDGNRSIDLRLLRVYTIDDIN